MTLGLGMSFLLGHPDLPVIIQFSTLALSSLNMPYFPSHCIDMKLTLHDQFHPPAVDIHSSRTDLDHLLVLHKAKTKFSSRLKKSNSNDNL